MKRLGLMMLCVAALLLTGVARAATLLRDDFRVGNSGWMADAGGGGNEIEWSASGEYLYLHDDGSSSQFPLVGRNDAFDAFQPLPNPYWRLSLRFRYPQLTGYGVTIATGTAGFNTSRGGGIRMDWENILRVTQRSGDGNFQVGAFGTVHYVGTNSTAWHTLELDVDGSSYVLCLDGTDIGSGTPSGTPNSLWFGNYTIQPDGDWSDVQIDWVELIADLEAPATTATPSGIPGNAGWWRSSVLVSLSAADAWSGVAGTSYRIDSGVWVPYDGSFTVSSEGVHTVEYRSADNAGNVEAVQTLAVNIDPTPPATSATSAGTAGCAGWYTSTVQVTLSASDATSGIALTQYQVNGGGWQAYAGGFALGDGSYAVDYRSTDTAGNQEMVSSLSLAIDTSPPSTSFSLSGTAGDNGWYRSNVDVTLSAEDALSGLDETLYRFDSGAWQTYAGGFTVSGDGVHMLLYYSTDVACNAEGEASELVNIDTVAPSSTIASLSDDDWINGMVSVAGSASDATSGVSLVDVSTDGGGSWQAASGTTIWSDMWDTTTVPDGDYDICSRGRDVAGNVESVSCVTVHVDNTAPATVFDLDGVAGNAGWWRSPVTATLSASDGSGIGVTSADYQVDGGAWQPYASPFLVSGEGGHTLGCYSVDGLGNIEVTQTLALNIDSIVPSTTAVWSGTLGLNGWYTDTVTVSLSASDATSGVDVTYLDGVAYTAPVFYITDGSYSLPYYSRDVAGNAEAAGTLAFGLDTTPPDVSVIGGRFCPRCGQVLMIQPSASDATSGLSAWRLEIVDGTTVVISWAGTTAPVSIPWNGRDGSGDWVDDGAYDLVLWAQDAAGWAALTSGQVEVRPKPSSPSPPQPTPTAIPSATSTPWPTWTPTPTGSPTPAPTLRPGETPEPTLVPSPAPTETPMPTSTPAPVAEAVPSVVLRVGVFRDDDEDATKAETEPGLAGLEVYVNSEGGWNAVWPADARGVVTITLPGPGAYEVSLSTGPREGSWAATTRRVMVVQVDADHSVVILPGRGNEAPVGTAPTCAFAFGLALRAVRTAAVWLPLVVIALLVCLTLGAVLDRRAKAIRELERTIGGVS